MENLTEALKMAFAIMMFILALTLSLSSFSQAREAIDAIITMRDREQEYSYIETSEDFQTRIVGIETIIPTVYTAYKENYMIEFYKNTDTDGDGELDPLYIYIDVDNTGEKKYVNYIDLERENFGNATDAIKHFDVLLDHEPVNSSDLPAGFNDRFIHSQGLYQYFKDKTFEERYGEFYQEDAIKGMVDENVLKINKTKKRLITYILQP